MDNLLVAVGILYREIEGALVDGGYIDRPGVRRVGEGFLLLDEICEIVVVEGVGLAQVTAGVELIEPDFASRRTLYEKQNNGLDTRALKDALRAIEYRVEGTGFEE